MSGLIGHGLLKVKGEIENCIEKTLRKTAEPGSLYDWEIYVRQLEMLSTHFPKIILHEVGNTVAKIPKEVQQLLKSKC